MLEYKRLYLGIASSDGVQTQGYDTLYLLHE